MTTGNSNHNKMVTLKQISDFAQILVVYKHNTNIYATLMSHTRKKRTKKHCKINAL